MKYARRRRNPPTAADIAAALEKVREEKRNYFISTTGGGPAAPPFSLINWILTVDSEVLDSPGCALLIVSWVLDLGEGHATNVALAERWKTSPEGARKRLIEGCYRAGWLAEALLGGHARRHQDRRRLRRWQIGPEEPQDRGQNCPDGI